MNYKMSNLVLGCYIMGRRLGCYIMGYIMGLREYSRSISWRTGMGTRRLTGGDKHEAACRTSSTAPPHEPSRPNYVRPPHVRIEPTDYSSFNACISTRLSHMSSTRALQFLTFFPHSAQSGTFDFLRAQAYFAWSLI